MVVGFDADILKTNFVKCLLVLVTSCSILLCLEILLYFKEMKSALKGKITTNCHPNVVSDLTKMNCSPLNHMLNFLSGL